MSRTNCEDMDCHDAALVYLLPGLPDKQHEHSGSSLPHALRRHHHMYQRPVYLLRSHVMIHTGMTTTATGFSGDGPRSLSGIRFWAKRHVYGMMVRYICEMYAAAFT